MQKIISLFLAGAIKLDWNTLNCVISIKKKVNTKIYVIDAGID